MRLITLYLPVFCTLVLGFAQVAVAADADPTRPPNVILIVADDLGWTDLGCYGSDLYESPALDRLAREGLKFTSAYSACTVCSPTRAALLTGQYPARLRVTDWIPGLPPSNPKLTVPDFTRHLPLETTTIAERLQALGYATASIGKWHLGGPDYYPERHGFDLNVGGNDQPQPRPGYFAPYDIDTIAQGPQGEYITDRLGAEAVKFIQASADRPFFLYMPHFAVHLPVQGKRRLVARYRAKAEEGKRHTNAPYAAMIDSMDQTVGLIRRTLRELQLADDTVIIFTSDNGGRIPTTSNVPLRAGKGSCHEGGVRVPLIVHWPGHAPPAGTCDVPVISTDLYPTILEIVGALPTPEQPCDGVSLVPLLTGGGDLAARPLYWHYPHYQHYQQQGTTPYGAIREGDWKFIEYYDGSPTELYQLRDDLSESNNLAVVESSKATELQRKLHQWLAAVDAQMPTPNPDYDPNRPEHERQNGR